MLWHVWLHPKDENPPYKYGWTTQRELALVWIEQLAGMGIRAVAVPEVSLR